MLLLTLKTLETFYFLTFLQLTLRFPPPWPVYTADTGTCAYYTVLLRALSAVCCANCRGIFHKEQCTYLIRLSYEQSPTSRRCGKL
jgi:hypothetical protein